MGYARAVQVLASAAARWGTGARLEGAVRVVAEMWDLDPRVVALDAAEARRHRAPDGREGR